ncbi:MAG: AtpZ/AtpI family protein [Planctomycetota bacterium]
MTGTADDNPRRPSGAPEIPAELRTPEVVPPKRSGPRFTLLPGVKTSELRAISVGLDFAAMVAAGAILGWLLSEWFDNRAWLWWWIGLGFVSAGWKFYKDVRILSRDLDREDRRRREGR